MLRIRDASESDVPALLRLHLDVLAEERWFITAANELQHDPFTLLEQLKDMRRRANCGWWVAVGPDGIVGFATAIGGHLRRIRHVARFEVMVAKHARGQGVGRQLTEHAIAWAQANPAVSKLSLAVFDDNPRAIALYSALGFVEEGRRPGEYVEDDGRVRGDVLMAMRVQT